MISAPAVSMLLNTALMRYLGDQLPTGRCDRTERTLMDAARFARRRTQQCHGRC